MSDSDYRVVRDIQDASWIMDGKYRVIFYYQNGRYNLDIEDIKESKTILRYKPKHIVYDYCNCERIIKEVLPEEGLHNQCLKDK